MSSLSIRHVGKQYGAHVQVIQDLNLDIADGEFMVFVGPSGCGKTTLLRMIAGLEDISAGDILFDNERVNDLGPAERGAAMVFQSYALYPHMTVAENMGFSLKIAGASKAAQNAAVAQAAEVLQITALLDRKPKALSGGQRQRVAIGRAIVRKPKVFLFDEPLSNLDANLRVQMRIELSRLHQELSTTMIYVTHDQVEAMTLGQRIAVFNAGRIEQVGTPLDLYHRPANLFVAEFMGSPKMNLMRCEASLQGASSQAQAQAQVQVGNAGTLLLDSSLAQPLTAHTLGLRPEHLLPSTNGTGLAVTVSLIEQLGDSTIVYSRLDGTDSAGATPRELAMRLNGSVHDLRVGQTLRITCDPAHIRLFDSKGQALAPHAKPLERAA
jgi:multiple sugar transport system ATP-binding protein